MRATIYLEVQLMPGGRMGTTLSQDQASIQGWQQGKHPLPMTPCEVCLKSASPCQVPCVSGSSLQVIKSSRGPNMSYCWSFRRLLAGCRGQAANPIAHVLQAIGEPLDLIEYNSWNVVLPEGQFLTEVCLLFCRYFVQIGPSHSANTCMKFRDFLRHPN